MTNIIHIPATALVNKPVPKNAFFKHAPAGQRAALQRMLTDEVERITWLYKLTAATLNVGAGKSVQEIDVFHYRLKTDTYDLKSFCAMDKLMPRHTVFVIEHSGELDLLMHHKERSLVRGEERWSCGEAELRPDTLPDEGPLLTIDGLDLDAVYYGLLSQVSGLHATTAEAYKGQAALRKQVGRLTKQVKALQKQVRAERQFNRQIELNGRIRLLEGEIARLKNQSESN